MGQKTFGSTSGFVEIAIVAQMCCDRIRLIAEDSRSTPLPGLSHERALVSWDAMTDLPKLLHPVRSHYCQ
jgi:hypothetical protein